MAAAAALLRQFLRCSGLGAHLAVVGARELAHLEAPRTDPDLGPDELPRAARAPARGAAPQQSGGGGGARTLGGQSGCGSEAVRGCSVGGWQDGRSGEARGAGRLVVAGAAGAAELRLELRLGTRRP